MSSTLTDLNALARPLTLPCGVEIKNRIAKAAMSEQLSNRRGAPTPGLARLSERWARGGAGLQITGNIMVDARSIGEPRNVVVEDDRDLDLLRTWAAAAAANGTVALAQINHPGRQCFTGLSSVVVAPSAVQASGGPWARPRALRDDDIVDIVLRFAATARILVAAGFHGVQLHAAHGYLINQFLSPNVNLRDDEWGGDAARRRRFLIAVTRAVRAAIGQQAVLAIKLNSADFQRGGFTEEESLDVIAALGGESVDLLEISGGTYEQAAMLGDRPASTVEREAYFLAFAERVRDISSIPLMVTGGFRTGTGMAQAVASGATDLVGLARPLALDPELPAALVRDPSTARSAFGLRRLRPALLNAAAEFGWSQHQIGRLAAGKDPDPRYGARRAAFDSMRANGINGLRRKRG